jgi:hypothetical protein
MNHGDGLWKMLTCVFFVSALCDSNVNLMLIALEQLESFFLGMYNKKSITSDCLPHT